MLSGEEPGARAERLLGALRALRDEVAEGSGELRQKLLQEARLNREGAPQWEKIAKAYEVLLLLAGASERPLKPLLFYAPQRFDNAGVEVAPEAWHLSTLAPWVAEARRARERGVKLILASATLDTEEVQRLLCGDGAAPVDSPAADVHLEDAPCVTRVALTPRALYREGTLKNPGKNLAAPLREIAEKFRQHVGDVAGKELVIATFKPVVEWLKSQLEAAALEGFPSRAVAPLESLRRDGCKLSTCYYGNLSGLDLLKEADGIATLGLPVPN